MQVQGGEGKLLDDQGAILYSPNPDELMKVDTGQHGGQALFYDMTAPGGTRSLAYYQPVTGRARACARSR